MPAKIASVKCLLKTCTKKFKDKRDMARHFLGRDHDRLCRDDRITKLKSKGFRFYRCKYEKYRKRAFPLKEPCGYRHFDKYLFKRHVLTHKKKLNKEK